MTNIREALNGRGTEAILATVLVNGSREDRVMQPALASLKQLAEYKHPGKEYSIIVSAHEGKIRIDAVAV